MLKVLSKTTHKGFTLIELLIVVLIIATLTGVAIGVLNTRSIKGKARDAQRTSDIKKIQAALELYFAQNRVYPSFPGPQWNDITGSDNVSTALSPSYINKVPTDPTPNPVSGSPCTATSTPQYTYSYHTNAGSTAYVLTALMETITSNDSSTCASLNNWSTIGCTLTTSLADICYGVENP